MPASKIFGQPETPASPLLHPRGTVFGFGGFGGAGVFTCPVLGLLLAVTLSGAAPDSLAEWAEARGGYAVADSGGRIVEVSLARTWATDADLDRLVEIPTLRKLDLSLTYVSDRGAEKLRKLEQLEDLNLYAAEFITDAAVSFLRGNRRLRRLNLRGTDITDTSVAYLAELTGLEALDLSYTQVSDVGLDHLAQLANLEELNLGGIKISGAGLHILKLLPKLKKLGFEGIQRRNAGYCWAPVVTDLELETIAMLSTLEELRLGWGVGLGKPRPTSAGAAIGEAECRIVGGIRITDAGLAKLARLQRLRLLDLSGAQVTSAGLRQLEKLPELRQLNLWNATGLDDAAGANLAKLRNLVSLDLSNTRSGDETLRQLAALTHLERLYLTDTKVTGAGVEALRKQRPNAFVSWGERPR